MSQVSTVRSNAIIPLSAGMDLTGCEGRPIALVYDLAFIIDSPDADPLFGVLLKGAREGETVSVAVAAGGLAGTVRLLLAANTGFGDYLQIRTTEDPPYGAFGPELPDQNHWRVAMALEPGVAGEKIEAVLFKPEFFTT